MRHFCFHVVVVSFALCFGRGISAQQEELSENPFGTVTHSRVSNEVLLHSKIDWIPKLEHGYRSKSLKPLVAFLDSWLAHSRPVAPDTMSKKPPFEQCVYDIYYALYKPKREKYLIIQNEITVVFVDSTLRREFLAEPRDRHFERVDNLRRVSTVVVKDFRPKLNVDPTHARVLYLQQRYLAVLVGFITQSDRPILLSRGERYQWEENGSSERARRLAYLNKALHIVRGHWGTGWCFETEPKVNTVYLSNKRNRAIVFFSERAKLKEALLQRVGKHQWELLTSRVYAIE